MCRWRTGCISCTASRITRTWRTFARTTWRTTPSGSAWWRRAGNSSIGISTAISWRHTTCARWGDCWAERPGTGGRQSCGPRGKDTRPTPHRLLWENRSQARRRGGLAVRSSVMRRVRRGHAAVTRQWGTSRAVGWILVVATLATLTRASAGEVSRPEPPALPIRLDILHARPAGRTIAVRSGGDLQAALDAAQPGDVITLEAGATFRGNFI